MNGLIRGDSVSILSYLLLLIIKWRVDLLQRLHLFFDSRGLFVGLNELFSLLLVSKGLIFELRSFAQVFGDSLHSFNYFLVYTALAKQHIILFAH